MTCGPHRTHRARSGRHQRHRPSGRPGAGRARRYGARHDPLGAHRAPRTSPRETGRLDITAPASVRRGATTARDTVDRLDMLVRCAGIMATPFRPSADGHELILATDSLGPVFLTHELLLHRAGRRRVVRAGSPEAVLGSIDLVDLNRQCNLRWMVGCRRSSSMSVRRRRNRHSHAGCPGLHPTQDHHEGIAASLQWLAPPAHDTVGAPPRPAGVDGRPADPPRRDIT